MKTIAEVLEITDLTDDPAELLSLLDEEALSCKTSGDLLGAGEWLVSKLPYIKDEIDEVFSQVVALWASPIQLKASPAGMWDVIQLIDEFSEEDLAIALANVTMYAQGADREPPSGAYDLTYRLLGVWSNLFVVPTRRSADALKAAAARVENTIADFLNAVNLFIDSHAINAKAASLEVVRKANQLKRLSVAGNRPLLTELNSLLGPAFRMFCESCERHDMGSLIERSPELIRLAQQVSMPTVERMKQRKNSTIWRLAVLRVAEHVVHLVDAELRKSESATTPNLELAGSILKVDLTRCNREMTISCRLVNHGDGRALKVILEPNLSTLPLELKIVSPSGPFDVGGKAEQIITFGLTLREQRDALSIPLKWRSVTLTGRDHWDADVLSVQQQQMQPDWERVVNEPPYTLKAIRKRESLYGRNAVLTQLTLNAAAGTSTFLWGQKRVGKTSVVQVLAAELQKRQGFVCLVLRMGEIKGFHEGQIAHKIAERLNDLVPNHSQVPDEQVFGASLGNLIPYVERLMVSCSESKFVLIIDEFDDLNPALYTGERGKLFVKALRSLSEMGLTFFFVGSERMNTIYTRHATELNQWKNVPLDTIESREDCKALVVRPVAGTIEYQPGCVDFIIDYCGANPFYMHLLCSDVFQRCYNEQRTYVGESDLYSVRDELLRTQREGNFAHFWEDNPELNESEKAKQAAQNCLVLCCLALRGGKFESIDELFEQQSNLGLGPSEQLSSRELRIAIERLQARNVIVWDAIGGRILLPVFKDWIIEMAELYLLPKWRQFCREWAEDAKNSPAVEFPASFSGVLNSDFPIPEEELLTVANLLSYRGKGKDVAEIILWLRQFDDDIRIGIAFDLVRRLAERGFVSEGAKQRAMSKVQQMLQATWNEEDKTAFDMLRGRRVNVCMTFLDSETKSGAITTRELAKQISPAKHGAPEEVANWIKDHSDSNPWLIITDDFSGTGKTLIKGFAKLFDTMAAKRATAAFEKLMSRGRVVCYLLYAFPEALHELRMRYPKAAFESAYTFGNDVRALHPEASIFSSEEERRFATDVLMQMGRGLYPQHPLGHGEMGGLVCFYDSIPNNSLPIFWSNGTVNEKPWRPLFPRA